MLMLRAKITLNFPGSLQGQKTRDKLSCFCFSLHFACDLPFYEALRTNSSVTGFKSCRINFSLFLIIEFI